MSNMVSKLPENWHDPEEKRIRSTRSYALKRRSFIPSFTFIEAQRLKQITAINTWAQESVLVLELLAENKSYSTTAEEIELRTSKSFSKGMVAGRLARLRELWRKCHGPKPNSVQREPSLDNPANSSHTGNTAACAHPVRHRGAPR